MGSWNIKDAWYFVGSGVLSGVISNIAREKPSLQFGQKWFPGLIFGALFGLTRFESSELVISYSVLSALTCWLAAVIASRIAGSFYLDIWSNLPKWYLILVPLAGLVAGGFGALVLSLILELFSSLKLTVEDHGLTTLMGAITGAVILSMDHVLKPKTQLGQMCHSSLLFTIWQLPVALVLSVSVTNKPGVNGFGFAEQFKSFLLGPAVQLVGLVGSVLGVISFFRRGKSGGSVE